MEERRKKRWLLGQNRLSEKCDDIHKSQNLVLGHFQFAAKASTNCCSVEDWARLWAPVGGQRSCHLPQMLSSASHIHSHRMYGCAPLICTSDSF